MKLPDLEAVLRQSPQDPTPATTEGPATPAAPVIPPRPAHAPTAGTYNGRPLPTHALGGGRLPAPGQTVTLTPDAPAPAVSAPTAPPEQAAPAAAKCRHSNPRTFRLGTSPVPVPYWCPDCDTALTPEGVPHTTPRGPVPLPAPVAKDDPEDTDAPGAEDAEDAEAPEATEAADVDGAPAPRWKTAWKRKTPGPDATGWRAPTTPAPVNYAPAPQTALIDRLRVFTVARWGLIYNGAAAGVGWKTGLIDWATNTTHYIDVRATEWTATGPLAGYAFAAVLLYLDWRYRRSVLPVAFAARIPLISVLLGVLLYGGTATL